jgi:two-component system, OmpR family, response regulator ChvI
MHVVIIEDDDGICFSLRLALEDKGWMVTVYSDPSSVPFATLRADVILVDFYMPQMNGKEVIKRLRQNPALDSVHIMLMSASPDLRSQAETLGVSYLAKPFDLQKLYSAIEAGQ